MPKTFIAVITGPTGSGKSTVANKLAKKFDSCTNIEVDHIKHFIVSGFHKEMIDGKEKWDFDQWGLVGESIGLLADNFQKKGFNVIINGYLNEPAWNALQKHIAFTHKFLLLPSIEVVSTRDKERSDEYIMGEEAVHEHHAYFSNSKFFEDFININSTAHNIGETVEAILKQLS